MHAFSTPPLYLALAGVATAWFFFIYRPDLAAVMRKRFGLIVTILDRKYGFDDFNDWFFAGGARKIGTGLWAWGDKTIIDGIMVNGTARLIGLFAERARRMQTGYIYHYAFTMIFTVAATLAFFWAFVGKY
jgi:NADH-quinone oxidoreductase subunit L